VYLKATWVLPFDAWRTRDASFHLASGGTVRVPLMSQRAHVWYVEGGGFQAVDLDYRGGDLSMLVLLPDDANGLPDLEARLSARVLQDCVEAMRMTEVRLFLPRFKLTWSADVCAPLRELGMALAFTAFQADFSGINGEQPPSAESLFLAAAYHKAFLDVHEMGTEAAAATMVGVTLGFSPGAERLPVPVFRADHRFLVVIRERRSGAILFLGRVENPAGDEV
jgi:serpin B